MNRELHIVGFKVGRETYGVPITALREIVRVFLVAEFSAFGGEIILVPPGKLSLGR